MIDSVEGAGESHTIFTTSYSVLRAVVTRQGTWSGFVTYATPEHITWTQADGYLGGSWDSHFARTFRLLYLSGGKARIVAVGDATVLEP